MTSGVACPWRPYRLVYRDEVVAKTGNRTALAGVTSCHSLFLISATRLNLLKSTFPPSPQVTKKKEMAPYISNRHRLRKNKGNGFAGGVCSEPRSTGKRATYQLAILSLDTKTEWGTVLKIPHISQRNVANSTSRRSHRFSSHRCCLDHAAPAIGETRYAQEGHLQTEQQCVGVGVERLRGN